MSGVTKWYGSFRALADVSLKVRHGEIVVLIGPSGAGKSTLLRCINRLETYSAGEIVVDGLEVSADRYSLQRVREKVGMVFQSFNLFPHLTVLNNVTIAPRLVRRQPIWLATEIAEDLLERVGMIDHRDKYPSQLSGGEQQRVAIARTLATEPTIILLDEPTASIDPELTKGILELMRDIAADGITMLIATHEMGFAHAVADRVLFFDNGQLIEDGPPSRVLVRPREERTRIFLDQVPTFWPTLDD